MLTVITPSRLSKRVNSFGSAYNFLNCIGSSLSTGKLSAGSSIGQKARFWEATRRVSCFLFLPCIASNSSLLIATSLINRTSVPFESIRGVPIGRTRIVEADRSFLAAEGPTSGSLGIGSAFI